MKVQKNCDSCYHLMKLPAKGNNPSEYTCLKRITEDTPRGEVLELATKVNSVEYRALYKRCYEQKISFEHQMRKKLDEAKDRAFARHVMGEEYSEPKSLSQVLDEAFEKLTEQSNGQEEERQETIKGIPRSTLRSVR